MVPKLLSVLQKYLRTVCKLDKLNQNSLVEAFPLCTRSAHENLLRHVTGLPPTSCVWGTDVVYCQHTGVATVCEWDSQWGGGFPFLGLLLCLEQALHSTHLTNIELRVTTLPQESQPDLQSPGVLAGFWVPADPWGHVKVLREQHHSLCLANVGPLGLQLVYILDELAA